VRFLGVGGMGRVYKARDPRLDRFVALKFLRGDDPNMLERFLREARAQAKVEHPAVCRVYEVGQVGEHPYIAMQYIDGDSLKGARERLTLEQKLLVIIRVAEAVHAAHRTGLIHRDIKPSNVLLELGEDGDWHPFVVDFGLALEAGAPGLTLPGMVVGTAAYMSPEQARGELATLDRRTDVYSLGATLYHALTGQAPFLGASTVEIMMRAADSDAVPVRKLAPSVPADVETIVMKCLDKDPQQRYPSARALGEDIQRFLDGDPVRARPISWLGRVFRQMRRHRALTALGGIAALLVVALAFVAVRSRWQAREQAQIAQEFASEIADVEQMLRLSARLAPHDIRPERARARQRLDHIRELMTRTGSAAQGPGDAALGRGFLALQRIDDARRHLDGAWHEGFGGSQVAYALGRTLGLLYQRAITEAQRERSRERRERLLKQAQDELRAPARSFLQAARAGEVETPAYVEGLLALYEDRHEEALSAARRALADVPWLYEAAKLEGDVHIALGRGSQNLGRYDQALAEYARAGQAFAAALEIAPSDPAVWEGECGRWVELVGVLRRRGDSPEAALAQAERACSTAIRIDPEHGAAYSQLSTVRCLQGDHQRDHGVDPRAALQLAVAAAEQALGISPADADAAVNIGWALYQVGDYEMQHGINPESSLERSVAALGRAIAINPNDAYASNALGYAHDRRAKYLLSMGHDPRGAVENALTAFRRALAADPGFAFAYNNIGITLQRRAEYECAVGRDPRATIAEARAAYGSALALNPNYAYAYDHLGAICALAAEVAANEGEDPSVLIAAAREAYAKGTAINPDVYWAYTEMVKLELVEASWALKQGRNPGPSFAAARRVLARALEFNPASAETCHTGAQLLLIEVEWASRRGTPARDLVSRGLELANRALEINPKDTEAQATRASLQLVESRTLPAALREQRSRQARQELGGAVGTNPMLLRWFQRWLEEVPR
jgi:tetratricopeptide (TPR) repeat protein/predicted Ser/Thr protein kinase